MNSGKNQKFPSELSLGPKQKSSINYNDTQVWIITQSLRQELIILKTTGMIAFISAKHPKLVVLNGE